MFNIKVYNNLKVYKFTQSPAELSNDLSYTANTNGGLARLSIFLNREIDDNPYNIGDFVDIKEYNENIKSGRDYYSGVVQNMNLIAENNEEKIEIELIGNFYLLNKIIYQDGGRVFTKNDDPKNIIDEIISYFNLTYGLPIITTNTSTFGSNIDIEFENKNCREALDLVCEKIGRYRFIGADNVLIAQAKPNTPTHYLTYKHDIQNMTIPLIGEDIFNRLYLDYSGGSATYNDIASQTSYNILEKVENKSDIQSTTTANDYGNTFLQENGPKREVRIEVNPKYDIGSIMPGHTIKVRNSKFPIDNLQIIKINRKTDGVVLELDNLNNLGTLGNKLVLKN